MTSFLPSFRATGLALSLLAAGAAAQAQTVALVTKAAFAQQGAGGVGPLPPGARVLSDDGRYLVFESDAPNVVAGQVDLNGEPDVFLHDRVSDTLTLVSHVPGSAFTTGDLASFGARVSADGAWVTFVSFASDLVTGTDANLGGSDVYLFSRASGVVTLVSHVPGSATTTGNAGSDNAVISADGVYVAFASTATDLVGGIDGNAGPDVLLFNRLAAPAAAIVLVSHANGSATTAANDVSLAPQVSADGRYVAFASDATNLVAGASDTNNRTDVFLFDRLGATTLVSHASGTPLVSADDQSEAPTISADGAWVAFESDAENLVAGQVDPNGKSDVFLYGRAAGTNTLVSRSSASATTAGNERSRVALVSADGNWVAFESRASNLVVGTDTNLLEDVFLFSRATGTVGLASHRPALPATTGNDASFVSGLTANGALVVFHSLASDLTAGADANLTGDVFLFDRVGGGVALASHALAVPANAANGFSSDALPSANGSVVAFVSAASDLIVPTGALGRELYAHQVSGGANNLVSDAATTSSTAAGLPLVEPPHRRTVSDDGRWVVFTSDAPNLVAGQADPNGEPDVFLYDALNDTVTLVSHASGFPARAGSADSARPSLSADGAWVAFASNATDLLATPQLECQVYLWERATGNVTLVSHAAASATQAGNDCSDGPALGGDGTWLAFYSLATNLVASQVDTNQADDVFLYERATGLLRLASRSTNGAATAGNDGTPLVFGRGHDAPAISADGRYVAFPSLASNLAAGTDTNGATDVFLFDRVAGTTTLVSHAAGAATTAATGASDAPLLSADGAWLAYSSLAADLVTGQADANGGADVFLFSRASGTSALVSHADGLPVTAANAPAAEHALSADGAWLAWSSAANNVVTGVTDANGASDVFAQPRATGLSILVSRTAGAPATAADAASTRPTLAANGNSVAFVSSASNLAPGVTDANGLDDVFLYDRFHDTMALVSHVPTPVTTPGNSVSDAPALSGAGNHVVFASAATDLVPGDLAGPLDVFYSALPPVPVELEAFTIE